MLSGAADLAGASIGVPLGGKTIEAGAKLLATKPKDVPALKKAGSTLLLEKKKRVLVVIDDIDRLAPDEVRQLFTVIKSAGELSVSHIPACVRPRSRGHCYKRANRPSGRSLS